MSTRESREGQAATAGEQAASSGLIVVIGPPGAGKSTVGQLLAQRLDVAFVDTDVIIERTEGRTIPEIFVDSGEEAFRAVERQAVTDALTGAVAELSPGQPAVISLGGGAILADQTQAALGQGHTVIFLDVALRDAARRAGFDQGRPLLALNPRGQWLALMQHRRPIYESLATHIVDTGGRTAQEVVDAIVVTLNEAAVEGDASGERSGSASENSGEDRS
ncbi:shikimate kinase [Kineosphaera limosa]|uniref:Shikimate kinase n=1 Tax=Kineosphaera limosa NBRC 100340 TaxID=1184609 RepID=K6XC33_9MICO|nr:shikimate kinase [Kineosphaera limosa]NYD99185.1 shikimate kinase [Kineosphaera limosa]GAB96349.1 shikimate kinase [Kineosphaera limosa NBRC 100340]